MKHLDLTLPTLAENLALDEALLLEAEAGRGGEVLRLWESPEPGVVLGVSGKVADEVLADRCQADQVPILRRSSGGGTVLLGPGCLCFSLILNYEQAAELREIGCSYCFILGQLAQALADVAPGIGPAGTSDLAIDGRKVSGNAQQRKRRFLLHHGTFLYDADPKSMAAYLKLPARQPDYRAARSHDAFLTNLPIGTFELRRRLREAWQAVEEVREWPVDLVQQLVETKYSLATWNLRR